MPLVRNDVEELVLVLKYTSVIYSTSHHPGVVNPRTVTNVPCYRPRPDSLTNNPRALVLKHDILMLSYCHRFDRTIEIALRSEIGCTEESSHCMPRGCIITYTLPMGRTNQQRMPNSKISMASCWAQYALALSLRPERRSCNGYKERRRSQNSVHVLQISLTGSSCAVIMTRVGRRYKK